MSTTSLDYSALDPADLLRLRVQDEEDDDDDGGFSKANHDWLRWSPRRTAARIDGIRDVSFSKISFFSSTISSSPCPLNLQVPLRRLRVAPHTVESILWPDPDQTWFQPPRLNKQSGVVQVNFCRPVCVFGGRKK